MKKKTRKRSLCLLLAAALLLTSIPFDMTTSSKAEEKGTVVRDGEYTTGIFAGEYGIDQLLHIAIEGSIRYPVDGKEHMELWPCRFAVFLALIKAAVMDGEAYSRKCLQHVCRCDPVFRIF